MKFILEYDDTWGHIHWNSNAIVTKSDQSAPNIARYNVGVALTLI